MDVIFMNSENGKTCDPHPSQTIKLKDIYILYMYIYIYIYTLIKMLYVLYANRDVALSNISMYSTWKNVKSQTKTINLKYQL